MAVMAGVRGWDARPGRAPAHYVVAARRQRSFDIHHDVHAALAAHIAVAVVARDDLLHRERGEVVTRHGEGGLEGLDG